MVCLNRLNGIMLDFSLMGGVPALEIAENHQNLLIFHAVLAQRSIKCGRIL